MTIGLDGLAAAAVAYVAALFAVAFAAERRAAQGEGAWLRSPAVYTLSLSIYCTGWTFYGATGYAARNGLEFMTIYLGPSLVVVGWWWLLRRLVRVGRAQRATSIADLVSSRYGKSAPLAALVTLIALAGITPYIALQLQSIALSVAAFAGRGGAPPDLDLVALWTAGLLALFTILFGTRNLDAGERHHGIVTAIAVEAVVKLGALLAVGAFVVWGLAGGVGDVLDRIDAAPVPMWTGDGARWAGLIALSAAAFLTLPRMFQVMVVEIEDEGHLAVAGWAFPLYLLLMSLFVVPIAVVGLERLPPGSNPDLFVLTLPLSEGQGGLALLAFLGGLSSASSMVIVAAIALSTMISNHVVAPLLLRRGGGQGRDLRGTILAVRRVSIAGILALGLVYFRVTGPGAALSAIGLIAFAGVAQILPALVGGLLWRGATARGAAAGLILGALTWVWTLLLPAVGGGLISESTLAHGPWGIAWLRPEALFGIEGIDPLLHAAFWSLLLNAGAFLGVSLLSFPSPLERLQGEAIVNVFERDDGWREPAWTRGEAEPEALLEIAGRILGPEPALDLFRAEAHAQGQGGDLPDATPGFLDRLERELAGSVGAAAAHAVLGRLARGAGVTFEELIAVADEAQQIKEYSARLEATSREQERTARALREANARLTALGEAKDAFLSRVSHELRTPMTSIRSFSQLLAEDGLAPADATRFARIVEAEARRLTRLLDDLLDLSVLREGRARLVSREVTVGELIDRAVAAAGVMEGGAPQDGALAVVRDPAREAETVVTDPDRLLQVFVNLVANARKYCDAARPVLRVVVGRRRGRVTVDFIDNGRGIPRGAREAIFDPFVRLSDGGPVPAGGAGLGLAICREVMTRLGGSVDYLPGQGGGAFRVSIPPAPPSETAPVAPSAPSAPEVAPGVAPEIIGAAARPAFTDR